MTEYDFRALSPIDFEDFARDLLNAELGASFVTYAVGPDGGIDLRDNSGGLPKVAQCKHRPDARKATLVRAARAQAEQLRGLAIERYIFVTTAALSPNAEADVLSALTPLPVAAESIWHKGRLNTVLARRREVLNAHFKLWLANGQVLQRILNAAEWEKSEALLSRVADRLRLFVSTPAFAASMEMLESKNVVVISGAPGVGKSTLAEMILLNYWHDGWRIVNVTDDLDAAWSAIGGDPDGKLMLYCDDFLGQTDIAELSGKIPGSISLLLSRVRAGNGRVRLVLTTRDQVVAQAKAGMDDRLRRLDVDTVRTRVNLAELSRLAKARILFNHLHFTVTGGDLRQQLSRDRRYLKVIDHPNFNPRIVESATLRQSFSSVDQFYERIRLSLDSPEEVWAGSFEQLSPIAVSILFQLACTATGSLVEGQLRADLHRDGDPRAWISALRVLEGSWIRITRADNQSLVSLFDGSRRDFLHSLLAQQNYFDYALDHLTKTTQLQYLLELGRTSPTATYQAGERPLANKLENACTRIAERLTELFSRDLAAVRAIENLAKAKIRTARDNARGGGYFYQSVVWTPRIRLLNAAIKLSFFVSSRGVDQSAFDQQLVMEIEWLMPEVKGNYSDASELFELAAKLFGRDTRESRQLANELVVVAAGEIANTEDLNRLADLPAELLTADLIDVLRPKIHDALETEIDGIRQQSDPEMVDQWVEEVVHYADKYKISLYLDSLFEFQEELRVRGSRKVESPSRPRPSADPVEPVIDATIDRLFERLRTPEY